VSIKALYKDVIGVSEDRAFILPILEQIPFIIKIDR
jgi:hypothetical protein